MANTPATSPELSQSVVPSSNAARSALKIRREIWFDEYIGTQDQLIEAGLLQAGQFPGDPGRGKVMVSYGANGEPAERGTRTSAGHRQVRRVSRKTFCLQVRVHDEEREKRSAEAGAQHERVRLGTDPKAQLQSELNRLKELPGTSADYAEHAADMFWEGFNTFFRAHCQPRPHESGFSFKASDVLKFEDLARGFYWAILKTEALKFDHEHRVRKVTEAKVNAAKADVPLQRLLRAAVAQQDTKQA